MRSFLQDLQYRSAIVAEDHGFAAVAGSLALSRTLSSFLYETNPLDALIHAAVTALLLAVTTVACLAPARRAVRFDPMAALRHE